MERGVTGEEGDGRGGMWSERAGGGGHPPPRPAPPQPHGRKPAAGGENRAERGSASCAYVAHRAVLVGRHEPAALPGQRGAPLRMGRRGAGREWVTVRKGG